MIDNLTETLTRLRDEAYSDAKEKGLLDKDYPHIHWVVRISGDIAAVVAAEEAGERANQHGYNLFAREDDDSEDFAHNYSCFIKDTMEDKIASVCVRILAFMGLRGYSVSDFIVDYVKREVAHGDEREDFCKVFPTFVFGPLSHREDSTTINLTLAAILAYCELHSIDIFQYIELRMAYNKISE